MGNPFSIPTNLLAAYFATWLDQRRDHVPHIFGAEPVQNIMSIIGESAEASLQMSSVCIYETRKCFSIAEERKFLNKLPGKTPFVL